MRLGLFGGAQGRKAGGGRSAQKADTERLKAEVRRLLDLPETAVIAVNEIICADPACPGDETVILVMLPGERTRACKLPLAMADVTTGQLEEALRSL